MCWSCDWQQWLEHARHLEATPSGAKRPGLRRFRIYVERNHHASPKVWLSLRKSTLAVRKSEAKMVHSEASAV